MRMENLVIVPMTTECAHAISQWKYADPYDFYSHREENVEEYMDGTHFAATDRDGGIVGYFCFGKDARIPTVEENVYDGDFLDVGLGLRPDLCGKRQGLPFLLYGLDYARQVYNTKCFRLSVATFNERAIKVYTRAGFHIVREVTNSYFLSKFYIMEYVMREP